MTVPAAERDTASTAAPATLGEVAGEAFRELTLRVPDVPGYLAGHFPGLPVVPAAVQIGWVMEAAAPLLGGDGLLQRAEALKFKELLHPGTVFRLRIELAPAVEMLDFRLWDETRLFSAGRLHVRRQGTHG